MRGCSRHKRIPRAIWTKQRPMRDEAVLQKQVVMSTSSSLGQTVWVYRGSMWGAWQDPFPSGPFDFHFSSKICFEVINPYCRLSNDTSS